MKELSDEIKSDAMRYIMDNIHVEIGTLISEVLVIFEIDHDFEPDIILMIALVMERKAREKEGES